MDAHSQHILFHQNFDTCRQTPVVLARNQIERNSDQRATQY